MIDLLQYIVFGIIQGLTEPLPVSSSGHLRIFSFYLGLDVPDLHLETFLNAASLLAVFVVYRKDLLELCFGTGRYIRKRKPEDQPMFRLSFLIVIGTIPAVVVGGLLYETISLEFTHIYMVAGALLVTGAALFIIRKLNGNKQEGDITFLDAVIVGLAQSLALAPGISRSGATVVAAMARKIEPSAALKYSFFLSIPASLGSLVITGNQIIAALSSPDRIVLYTAAFTASFVISVFAIKLFIEVITSGKLIYFAGYCAGVAVLLFIFN